MLAALVLCLPKSVSVAAAQEAGSSAAEERAQARVFEALDLMDAGSYDEARLLIKVALELNPALDRAWYYLAQCDVELGRKAEAVEALDVYEGRDLTEYERTQVAELRKRVSQLPDEAGEPGDEEAQESTVAGDDEGDAESEADPDAGAVGSGDAAAEASTDPGPATGTAVRPPPGPGPVLLIAGGVVAALGAGFVAGGLSMADDLNTWQSGQGLYYAGLGMALGGGASAVVGIPLTVVESRKSVKVALSWSVDPGLGATALWVSGRW